MGEADIEAYGVSIYHTLIWLSGMEIDPSKTEAISQISNPETEEEVRSFLGMANYVNRFIPHYSHLSAPLRQLTQKTTAFVWTSEC